MVACRIVRIKKKKKQASKKRKVIKGKGLFLELLNSETVSLTSSNSAFFLLGLEVSDLSRDSGCRGPSGILDLGTLQTRSSLDFLSLLFFCLPAFLLPKSDVG